MEFQVEEGARFSQTKGNVNRKNKFYYQKKHLGFFKAEI